MKSKIDKEMGRLVKLGILKKGLSGYSSPAMTIPRKNSSIPRVVGDFRYLNKRLVKLNMTFPLVRECIQEIGASQCEVMSVIDLRDAYHTLRLASSSQQYTGITPYYGADTYQYLQMAMGLSISPAIWQTFINNILRQIPNKNRHIAIMDECLVHSKFAYHLQDLTNLFQSLIDNGLKISPKKCQFFRTELVYMGLKFLIYNGRPSIMLIKDKCEAIRRLNPPKKLETVENGMVNFLATFLKDLQKILIPIYNLTRKCIKFLWTDKCQKAFDHINFLLSNPPILRMPDMTGTFQLMSDTSILEAGAALYQYQGSAFYIVGYNSKKLPKAVQNYSVTELELFGLVVNIYAFKQLLTNVYFEVFCDHSAVVQILNGKKKLPTRRIQRLIEHLLPFNFTVQYLPCNKIHIMDILSRLAGKELEPSDQLIQISFNVYTRSTRLLKQYYANKHRISIPYQINTPKSINPKPSILRKHPPKLPTKPPKPTTIGKTPPVPIGILRKVFPTKPLPPQKEPRKSLVNPNLKIPQSLPPLELPPPQSKEIIETYRLPDESLYHKPLPILKDAEELDVFTRHIPKQTDIDRCLQILKAKVTKSYDLSVTATELAKEYLHSPAFSSIYNCITQNVLPKDKRSQRMVIAKAKNYIVANGILFRLIQQKKVLDTSIKCLLVVPEKFEYSVLHMFHDTLLGAHYGPVNTYYTIEDRYWIHNMFGKLQRYISSCEACQQQKQKRGKIPYSHPRIPLSYNPMSYISADIKYMPKGIYDYEFLTYCSL